MRANSWRGCSLTFNVHVKAIVLGAGTVEAVSYIFIESPLITNATVELLFSYNELTP